MIWPAAVMSCADLHATSAAILSGQRFKHLYTGAYRIPSGLDGQAQSMAQNNTKPVGRSIRFQATLLAPQRTTSKPVSWTFLTLPPLASAALPSRSMVSIEGTLNGSPFRATLEPDGQGGHWLKVDRKMRDSAGVKPGQVVTLDIAPAKEEPEPKLPPDLRKSLAAAPLKARQIWSDITPIARRDWIHWIVSAKQAETRARRITSACDMLAKGKRRPCCFDRSGMYAKSLTCPIAEDHDTDNHR